MLSLQHIRPRDRMAYVYVIDRLYSAGLAVTLHGEASRNSTYKHIDFAVTSIPQTAPQSIDVPYVASVVNCLMADAGFSQRALSEYIAAQQCHIIPFRLGHSLFSIRCDRRCPTVRTGLFRCAGTYRSPSL